MRVRTIQRTLPTKIGNSRRAATRRLISLFGSHNMSHIILFERSQTQKLRSSSRTEYQRYIQITNMCSILGTRINRDVFGFFRLGRIIIVALSRLLVSVRSGRHKVSRIFNITCQGAGIDECRDLNTFFVYGCG